MFDGLRSIRGVLDAWTEDREDDADGRGEWQFGGGRTTIGERYGEVEASVVGRCRVLWEGFSKFFYPQAARETLSSARTSSSPLRTLLMGQLSTPSPINADSKPRCTGQCHDA